MANETGDKDLILRSREIDDIIGKPPHWLIRWGIGIFFFVLILVIALSALVRYPETIITSFKISSTKATENIVPETGGKIARLFVKEGSYVHTNDTLFILKTGTGTNGNGQLIFTAPVEGAVNFTNPLQENQKVIEGQTLFCIMPAGGSQLATIYVGKPEVSKLKPGQRIILKLTDYPFEEYGSINGMIDYISDVYADSVYYVKVALPTGLKTNYGKIIPYKEGLSGSAEIIISEKKLINKLIDYKN
ncbi:MAG: HlyD family efflux transporter periplasmic adaptor subunit [Bacteroidetes bacterium]|nr:HlyD family efflux transporter periplasmic adaptor subunit [Bacteroidota bacterium]